MRGSAALLTDQSAAQEAFQIFDTLSADVARFVTILLQVNVFKKSASKVVFYMKFCNPLLTIFRKTLADGGKTKFAEIFHSYYTVYILIDYTQSSHTHTHKDS